MIGAMKQSLAILSVAAFSLLIGCQTTPPTEARKATLDDTATAELKRFQRMDTTLNLDNSYGYAIFPAVDEGAFIIGAGYGRGVVYEHGQKIGYADMTKGTVGAQIGGQRTSQLIVFENKESFDRFKANSLAFGANATATAITAGASNSVAFDEGVKVFIAPNGGLMAKAAVGGQKFTYVSNADAERATTANDHQRSATTQKSTEEIRGTDGTGTQIETKTEVKEKI